ncbi:hypothetical protein D3C87_1372930 [compost metagenome]
MIHHEYARDFVGYLVPKILFNYTKCQVHGCGESRRRPDSAIYNEDMVRLYTGCRESFLQYARISPVCGHTPSFQQPGFCQYKCSGTHTSDAFAQTCGSANEIKLISRGVTGERVGKPGYHPGIREVPGACLLRIDGGAY